MDLKGVNMLVKINGEIKQFHELTERAQIFVKKHGDFNSLRYMTWIQEHSRNYKKKNNLNQWAEITDQEAFTEFIKEEEKIG